MSLQEKVVVVTGAASGVGRAVGGELPQAHAWHVLQDQVAGVTRVDVVDPGAALVMDAVRHGELAPGVVTPGWFDTRGIVERVGFPGDLAGTGLDSRSDGKEPDC